jgi:hypothetical protein
MKSNGIDSLSQLISIYLVDYENIREEIRMRITQRHQFTNYSLILFAALFSFLVSILLKDPDPSKAASTISLSALTSEYMITFLVAPLIFYSLLFMYIRHDFYIIHMAIYLEKYIGAQVRKLLSKDVEITDIIDKEYILGWEKLIQEIRQENIHGTHTAYETFIDFITKHFPFYFPIILFIGICSVNIWTNKYPNIIYILYIVDILVFIFVIIYILISTSHLMKSRSY